MLVSRCNADPAPLDGPDVLLFGSRRRRDSDYGVAGMIEPGFFSLLIGIGSCRVPKTVRLRPAVAGLRRDRESVDL